MLYHMQVHCHSSMPIESLAEARLIWRENFILFQSDTTYFVQIRARLQCGMLKNKFASKYQKNSFTYLDKSCLPFDQYFFNNHPLYCFQGILLTVSLRLYPLTGVIFHGYISKTSTSNIENIYVIVFIQLDTLYNTYTACVVCVCVCVLCCARACVKYVRIYT